MHLAAALFAAPAFLLGGPAAAAPFDGNWSVEVVTERGDCDKAYRYGVVIENGRVRYGGGSDFTVSGSVAASGAVKGSIVRGSDRADVTGKLTGASGRGTWKAAGGRSCSGSWNADRRGS